MTYGMTSKTSVNDDEDLSDISYAYGSVMGQEAQADSGVYYTEPETEAVQSTTTSAQDRLNNNYTLGLMNATSSGSTSGGSSDSQIGQVSVSGTKYSGAAPTLGALPVYKGPEEWTGEKMAGETQKKAALGLRQARQSLREATAGLGTDPASRLALRQALAQHGINIQGTMSQAESAAETAEANELARKTSEAQMKYQAETTHLYQTYQTAWNKYISTGKNYNISTGIYSGTGGSGSTEDYYTKMGLDTDDLLAAVSGGGSKGNF